MSRGPGSMEVDAVLEKLRASLKRRGAEGIRGLARHFKIVDRDNSKSIDADEFSQLCNLNRLGLSQNEQNVLMRGFDSDGNGRVDYEEFLRGVRGRLSPTRKKMVRQIFDALDKIGGELGYLTIAAIRPIYSVTNHPQVKAGKMSKDEALQEFLNGFEGSQGNRDGRITLDEWIKYYEEVSVSVDSDDYFGTMLAGTWAHLKRRAADGAKTEPVVKFTAKADVDRLEKQLRAYIYAKVPNDQNTKRQVQKAFGDFDTDGSGAVSMSEFVKALERFGMHVAGQRPGIGGLPMDVVQSLFDKYDKDSSGQIDYREFTAALFKGDEAPILPPAPENGKQKGKAGIKKPLCDDTAYLKMSNHIFGPISRGETHDPGRPGGLGGIAGKGAQR